MPPSLSRLQQFYPSLCWSHYWKRSFPSEHSHNGIQVCCGSDLRKIEHVTKKNCAKKKMSRKNNFSGSASQKMKKKPQNKAQQQPMSALFWANQGKTINKRPKHLKPPGKVLLTLLPPLIPASATSARTPVVSPSAFHLYRDHPGCLFQTSLEGFFSPFLGGGRAAEIIANAHQFPLFKSQVTM